MSKIAVIITVYNVEKFIASAIESVLGQTFRDFELILVDDGTTDKSGSIIDEYEHKDSRIKVIHQKNGGVMAARMKGLKESDSEWITFLDGDDRLVPKALEILYYTANDYNADIVASQRCYYDEKGVYIKEVKRTWFIGEFTKDEFLQKQTLAPTSLSGKLYRASLLKEASIVIDRKIYNNEDHIFNIFLGPKIKKVIGVPDSLYCITVNHQSVSRSNSFSYDYWQMLLLYVKEEYKKYDLLEVYYLQFCLCILARNLRRCGKYYRFNTSIIKDVGKLHFSANFSIWQNLMLALIKHPSKLVVNIITIPIYPRLLLAKWRRKMNKM